VFGVRRLLWTGLVAAGAGLALVGCGASRAAAPVPRAAGVEATPTDPGGPGRPLPGAIPPVEVVHGNEVDVTLVAEPARVRIADGVWYDAWTFDGQVPGPVVRVRQGQVVHVTFINRDPRMSHSLDMHAASTAPSVSFREVAPGHSTSFTFVADHPGVFLYHCGTPPMVEHIANGMYGVVIVDPATPRPPAQEYVLVQSEWYGGPVDLTDMEAGRASYVVFNGVADQYAERPLPVRAGEPLRLYVVNAGPDHFSAFHVVGAVFDTVEPSGSPEAALHGLQAWTIAPGDAAVFELTLTQPGRYPFVTHAMDDEALGAVGAFLVSAHATAGPLLPSAAEPARAA
jgi:nitrite reductase (NO-forming)